MNEKEVNEVLDDLSAVAILTFKKTNIKIEKQESETKKQP